MVLDSDQDAKSYNRAPNPRFLHPNQWNSSTNSFYLNEFIDHQVKDLDQIENPYEHLVDGTVDEDNDVRRRDTDGRWGCTIS